MLVRQPHEMLARRACAACGTIAYDSPTLLVSAYIFAEDRLLLLRRGAAPYEGKWAPPTGFVEAHEPPDEAIAREVVEEVGVHAMPELYRPLGITSLPTINQVYVTYILRLRNCVPLRPCSPEVLEAGWFTLGDYPQAQIWEPERSQDVTWLYETARSGRFEFFQQTGLQIRRIGRHDPERR
jgi:ADP-ribose pyrophosphatase YjhB (NUDIX family)